MPESLEVTAHFLAYCWYRSSNFGAPVEEAWDFAKRHWQDFLTRHDLHQDLDDAGDALLAYEGPSQILAEK